MTYASASIRRPRRQAAPVPALRLHLVHGDPPLPGQRNAAGQRECVSTRAAPESSTT
jgi:hypothetical protein